MAKNGLYNRFNAFLERHMPEGLFPRALIILVAPVVLLQTIMTGLIFERHFENVTRCSPAPSRATSACWSSSMTSRTEAPPPRRGSRASPTAR